MATTRMADNIGRVLGGRYRLLAPLGAGASGRVYLADDVALRRRVAVKVLHDALADDEAFLRRFRAEAQAAAALNHANVMGVFDWGDDGGPFLVLEYLAGGSLRTMLDAGSRLTPSQALLVGLEVCRGLDFAHRRGIVHRDIKPANLLFDDDGHLHIADFGVARALAEAAWTEPSGVVLGSARYASPEQARGERVDGKADVYALGLVLIESVTGSVPFTSDTTIATLMARIDRPVQVPEVLGRLRPALERAGAVDPADRPDAAAFGQALFDVAPDLPSPKPLPLAPHRVDGEGHADPDPTVLPPLATAGAAAAVTAPVATATPGASAADARFVAGAEGVADVATASTPAPAPAFGTLAPEAAPRPRRRWTRVLVLALLIALLGGGGAWAYQWFTYPTAKVPDVRGLELEEAERILEAKGRDWNIVVTRKYLDGTDAGFVINQDPANSRLREGGTVHLVVSRGPPLIEIPTIAGTARDDAAKSLRKAGFDVGADLTRFDEVAPADTVLSWKWKEEAKPAQVPKGETIRLVVSLGPAPREVPDLAGMKYKEAAQALEDLGLVAVRVDVFDSTVDKGKVVGTEPALGASVDRGSTVQVKVSKGPDLVVVPDVRGARLSEAIATLEAAGLVAGEAEGPSGGEVFTTDPEPGTKVERGTEVTIFMHK